LGHLVYIFLFWYVAPSKIWQPWLLLGAKTKKCNSRPLHLISREYPGPAEARLKHIICTFPGKPLGDEGASLVMTTLNLTGKTTSATFPAQGKNNWDL
jgi:hypothetical protein